MTEVHISFPGIGIDWFTVDKVAFSIGSVSGLAMVLSQLINFPISVISLVRRSNCVLSFLLGAFVFREKGLVKKFIAMLLILLGIALLSSGK